MQQFFNNYQIIKPPTSSSPVVFQCDENFFNRYGIYNLISCEKNNMDVHIHFINPTHLFLDKINGLDTKINLSYSKEFIDTDINFYKLKSYYFCSRYFITNYLFELNLIQEAFITDADIIFNENIKIPQGKNLGILYYPTQDSLWKKTGANISYVSRERKLFLETVIKIYKQRLQDTDFDSITMDMPKLERANLYALDQVCMSLALQENFIDDHFVNLTSIPNLISKNNTTKIWSLTGAGQKSNPKVHAVLNDMFDSYFSSQFANFR
jgi:hypothetical protein